MLFTPGTVSRFVSRIGSMLSSLPLPSFVACFRVFVSLLRALYVLQRMLIRCIFVMDLKSTRGVSELIKTRHYRPESRHYRAIDNGTMRDSPTKLVRKCAMRPRPRQEGRFQWKSRAESSRLSRISIRGKARQTSIPLVSFARKKSQEKKSLSG
jgi:hypothetical protein